MKIPSSLSKSESSFPVGRKGQFNSILIVLFLLSEVLKALLRTRELYSRWRAVEEGKEIR